MPAKRKRPNGDGSYDRLPNGTWRGRVTLGGARRAVYAPTRAGAVAAADALKARHASGTLPGADAARATVADALAALLAAKHAEGLQARHVEQLRTHCRTHLAPLHAVRLERLTARDVRALLAALLAERAPATVRHVRATLRMALALAVRDGLLARNVVDAVPAPRLPRRPARALQDAELARFWTAARASRLYALWLLAARTGLRQGEQRALRWADIDPAAGTLTVARTLPFPGFPEQEKAAKSAAGDRTFDLTPGLLAALQAHRARQAAERLRAGARWHAGGLVFCTRTGTALVNNAIWRAFQVVKRRAGLPAWVRPHDLRHTAASHLLAAGVPLAEVAAILGHANAGTTTTVYGHWVRRGGRAALLAVEARDPGWTDAGADEVTNRAAQPDAAGGG